LWPRQRQEVDIVLRLGVRTLTGTILQFIIGGILLCFFVWLKIHDLEMAAIQLGATKAKTWIRTLARTALVLVAAACLLDPLIPGFANLTVKISTEHSTYPTLLENLRVRVVPVGFLGQAGGDRIAYAAFGSDGSAEVLCDLALLETRVTIQVFDQTQPSETIKSANVYISPFVRRQLVNKTISF
jgi:hypothetical protein